MPSPDVEDLCRRLVREHLVEQPQVDGALVEIGPQGSAEELLQRLESRGYLTSYQISRIQKGEWDGLILGHYKVLYRNASGSFARVFRAVDLKTGKMVGLKVLRQRWAAESGRIKEFVREAEMCRPLRHPNIVPIYEVGQDGEYHYFTMEFVEGGNLRDFIKIREKLSPAEATKCILEVTEGLNYAFNRGITHRDLKLTNVLMSTSGVAKLVDFGLGGGPSDDSQDAGESLQRAVEYATIEKNTGAPRNDPRSDMYFLGVMYYELLIGEPPFPRTRDRVERSQFSRYQNVRPVRERDPSIPGSVCAIVDRLMHLNPNVRYQTPAEAIPDLQRALAELGAGGQRESQPAPRAGLPEPDRPLLPTILFIESRVKHQDMLRDYFTKHKFRVLVLTDLQRGISRMRTTPPDAVIVMAEGIGEDVVIGFRELQEAGPTIAMMLILSEKQAAWKDRVRETATAKVLVQPITLRDLRKSIEKLSNRAAQAIADDD